ncbi:MAG TPA: hypothetical protein PLE45_06520 [Spirochaetota bacterium]|nr:hypothetical protein [Spirochaetota bacterium]HOL57772.1 hypothetical protein [Spirochaetota bacterium]HPP05307.1 hypothetical protein [Spirochaetota bacterium]
MPNVEDIKVLIKEIQTHYEKHLNNKYVKNIILKLDLPLMINQDKNIILTNEILYLDSKGSIEDIYEGIIAVNYVINEIEKNVVPNLSQYVALYADQKNENEKILAQMAIKNYPMNIKILKDKIKSLFFKVYDFDKINFSKDPAYKKVRNFSELEKLYLSNQ